MSHGTTRIGQSTEIYTTTVGLSIEVEDGERRLVVYGYGYEKLNTIPIQGYSGSIKFYKIHLFRNFDRIQQCRSGTL